MKAEQVEDTREITYLEHGHQIVFVIVDERPDEHLRQVQVTVQDIQFFDTYWPLFFLPRNHVLVKLHSRNCPQY